ncbi:MAG: COP23 domain-containing protein [Cyanobacteria bacterium P01_A01_bin.135]
MSPLLVSLLTLWEIAILVTAQPKNALEVAPSAPPSPVLQFSCELQGDRLATVARTPDGMVTPIIFWNAADIDTSELSAPTLCEQATERFQTYHQNQQLTYLTTGRMNRRPVACVADALSGGCLEALFPLKPGEPGVPEDRPPLQLTRILRIRSPIVRQIEETGCRLYIGFDQYLSGEPEPLCPDPS